MENLAQGGHVTWAARWFLICGFTFKTCKFINIIFKSIIILRKKNIKYRISHYLKMELINSSTASHMVQIMHQVLLKNKLLFSKVGIKQFKFLNIYERFAFEFGTYDQNIILAN